MEPTTTIRTATAQDLPEILEIYNDIIINTNAVYSEEPHTLAMRLNWFNERLAAGFPVIVAVENGTVTGFASYGSFRAWPCFNLTAEHSVYVHKDYRGKGISKFLLQELIVLAKKAGLHVLMAGIDSENGASIHLHSKFGFVKVGHFNQVGYKFGQWLDLVFMQLTL
jgi:L-amino acid N-acyltransferase YncA